ncbi:mycobactin polyketide synthase MbtD [Mycolicibacterium sediminis]|uniref:Polyketide synthase n=1 Tax=Mycolicibacterium sediminis TaxID=1286180 RepID=A0A7I7QWL8_9MYCO|nr:mycobactin polyketide synthase MbtD [Mycolicibacterium sediminis]BBY30724.1 polyketide synthase [Mycolicibacterium sediminis]
MPGPTLAALLPDGRTPVLLSAHAEDLLGRDAAAIVAYLDARDPAPDVVDVAGTVLRTRRLRRHRAVVRAADRAEMRAGLTALADGVDHPLVTRSTAAGAHADPARIAFVFPGQGSQWPAMGHDAYERLPEYRAEADACAALFTAAGAASPLDYLLAEPSAVTNDFSQVQIQGAQFVHGVALARVWRSAGVVPDITVGHSLGEIGAAYVAGSLTPAVAVDVVIARATLLDRLTGPYRVAVLGITADEARDVIAGTPGWLELSVVNSRSSVAISGDGDAVAAAVRTVGARGSFAKEIEMWFPAHTTALDPMRADLEALLPRGAFTDTAVHVIGSATGGVVAPGTSFADYWYANLRSTVRFDLAVEAAVAAGARIFVEMSAHPALLFAIGDVLDGLDVPDGAVTVVGSGRRDEPVVERLSANLVAVALADPGHRWADALGGRRDALREFPFAPMRSDHLWAAPEPLPPVAGLTVALEHWEPTQAPAPSTVRRVAILGAGELAARLRDAVARLDRTESADPAHADLLVVVAPEVGHDDVAAAVDDLARRVGHGPFAHMDAIGASTRAVWLVTTGGERVTATDPTPSPTHAALAAMHRSVGFEFPEQHFGHLDLPRRNVDADAAVAAMLGDDDVIALRDGRIHRRGMRDVTTQAPPWTRASGILDEVVITGGGGAIGMHYARGLAQRGARRVTLLSRGGADAAVLAGLTEAYGTEFRAPRCDVTDGDRVAAAAIEIGVGAASLVIHAAGTAVVAPHRELTAAAAHDTFAAKVLGLATLITNWPIRSDARILACSSVSGPWGGRGHAVYSAANRLLDVLVAQLRSAGRDATAIRWGLWEGAGIIDASAMEDVERSGLRAMRPDRAVEESLRDHVGDPLVFSADPIRLRAFLGERVTVTENARPPVEDAETRLDATGAFRLALGSVLDLPDDGPLDLDASLLDLGVDSLLALDLRKRLKKATGRTVPLATILGGATATEVIGLLDTPEEGARET